MLLESGAEARVTTRLRAELLQRGATPVDAPAGVGILLLSQPIKSGGSRASGGSNVAADVAASVRGETITLALDGGDAAMGSPAEQEALLREVERKARQQMGDLLGADGEQAAATAVIEVEVQSTQQLQLTWPSFSTLSAAARGALRDGLRKARVSEWVCWAVCVVWVAPGSLESRNSERGGGGGG